MRRVVGVASGLWLGLVLFGLAMTIVVTSCGGGRPAEPIPRGVATGERCVYDQDQARVLCYAPKSSGKSVRLTGVNPSLPPGSVNVANIWVATNGNDGTAARSATQVTNPGGAGDFLTFGAAHQAAHPGDIIGVSCGTYGQQVLTQRTSPAEAAPNETFAPATSGCVLIAGAHTGSPGALFYGNSITFGNTGNNATPLSPSYLTIYGMQIRGTVMSAGLAVPGRIGIVRNHIWDVNNQENDLVGCCGSYGTIAYNEIGPTCCSNDMITFGAPDFGTTGTVTNGSADITNVASNYVALASVGDPVACDCAGFAGGATVIAGSSGTTLKTSSTFGGTTASGVNVRFQIASLVETGARIFNNYMHDITITCAGNPDVTCDNSVSNCTYDFGTSPCDHPDGFQITAGNGMQITNNQLYGTGCQGIFIATAFQNLDSFTGSWLIAGNMIDLLTQCPASRHSIAIGGSCSASGDNFTSNRVCFTGAWKILYNTTVGDIGIPSGLCMTDCQGANQDATNNPGYFSIWGALATVVVAGNLSYATGYGLGVNDGVNASCALNRSNGATFSVTFSKNRVGAGQLPCGTDTAGDPGLVYRGITQLNDGPPPSNAAASGASTALVDLSLSPATQTGISASGESTYCGPGKAVSVDLNGTPRPGGGLCNIGADQ